ncbi:nitroreductase [Paenibacillus curdlanolyticus YK9]|uniref:Nitroreductase n=1 Tax=Paenibacillus curdlanolyticus YK9 TaxID=717606 RepID=E0I3J9_9BACL|nr:nitroreductase family protein [Paenibacillus curdlanolyticus]EFM12863.1 nitroreductase [Paenibacillus curdlanolyticus YK9]
MSEFVSIVKDRRSANRFVEGVKIPRDQLDEILNLTKYAPSAYNLQHTHYYVVTDRELIEKIYEAAYKQYKVKTASAVIFVFGDTKAHLQAASLNEGMKTLGIISEEEYDRTVNNTIQFYESRGEAFQREDALRNAGLSAMQFMLIAKEKGWDTCPMHSIDESILRGLLDVPEQFVPVMMITIGKSATESFRPRGYRKPVNEFVRYFGE